MGTITTVTKSGANAVPRRRLLVPAQQRHRRAQHLRDRQAVPEPAQLRRHRRRPDPQGQDILLLRFRRPARRRPPTLFTPNVPTLAMRQGDFSGFAALKNPFTGVNPFAEIPSCPSSSAPQALKVQNLFFPLPNFGAAHPHRRATTAPPSTAPKCTAPKRSGSTTTSADRHSRLPALRESQGRLPDPRRALAAAAHHGRHLRQHPPREFLDRSATS